ncbi:MAG: prepilin-type N-terminal cleavage/methylation domain-containing protein [Chromatiaceae bacterium]|jgi:general secretion pathway protein I|nr:prepilin-type N-terminal cleavage/methylation domain-containing protein [Chromatiaceae bacterium]
MARPRRQHGFSLLEVLVSFSILALSLGVLMQIFSLSSRNAGVSADYAKALTIAESRLAEVGELIALTDAAAGQELDGRFDWRLNSVPIESEYFGPSAVAPYRVTVTVEWGSAGQRRSLSLETVKLERQQ